MTTLKDIKKIMMDYFINHKMINDVFYLNDFDFNAERNIQYSVANVSYESSSINNNVITHQYIITLADKTELDNNDLNDNIHSDMLMIAEDFITHMQNQEEIFIDKSSTLTPFIDDAFDLTSGITFGLNVNTIRPQNKCNQPT